MWVSEEFEDIVKQGFEATNRMMKEATGKEISMVEYSRYLANAIGEPMFPSEITAKKRGTKSNTKRMQFDF